MVVVLGNRRMGFSRIITNRIGMSLRQKGKAKETKGFRRNRKSSFHVANLNPRQDALSVTHAPSNTTEPHLPMPHSRWNHWTLSAAIVNSDAPQELLKKNNKTLHQLHLQATLCLRPRIKKTSRLQHTATIRLRQKFRSTIYLIHLRIQTAKRATSPG